VFLNRVSDRIGGQVEGFNQLLIRPGMNELSLAIALECIDGGDPVPIRRPSPWPDCGTEPSADFCQIYPLFLFRQN